MKAFKPVLSSKGLLAASIAMLSGHAMAETAGRVSFVTGTVTAKSGDGSTRQLQKGDIINGGDKISTQAGRVQIRFTDGGFVSLQPNTVFGVDEYLYTNRKPEETSLFFSLLQGGMRTLTGAIGKVNKQSYKVRTPVATIGIRGTEYLASLTERGLIVSVGSGFVNVANEHGDITGGAGQNISVPDGTMQPGLSEEGAEVFAAGLNGDTITVAADNSHDNGTSQSVAVGNAQNANGDYIFLFTTEGKPLPNSNLQTGAPVYYVMSPGSGLYSFADPSLPSNNYNPNALAIFDQDGSVTGSAGGLRKIYERPVSYDPTSPVLSFDSGTLQVANNKTVASLSWGEFTNGSSGTVNKVFDTCGDGCFVPFTLASNEFIPYIVGAPATSNLGKGTATYTLQGGTPARGSNGKVGTLDSFKISVNLDFSTIDVAMQVTMPLATQPAGPSGPAAVAVTVPTSNTYYVKTLNSKPVSILNLGTASQFSLDSSLLDVTDSNGGCGARPGSTYCTADISGFFAGDGASQIGASYHISSNTDGDISGVAGLGISTYNGNTTFSNGGGYTVAYAYPSTASLGGGYPSSDPASDNSLWLTFGSDGSLTNATNSTNEAILFDQGTTGTVLKADLGSTGALKWGRWYSNSDDSVTVPEGSTSLTPNHSVHYIVGPLTQPNVFNAFTPGSTATYTYQGGTTATRTDGKTGSIDNGSKVVAIFGPLPKVSIDMGITMSDASHYGISGSNISVNASTFSAASSSGPLSITGSGGACSSGCSTTVSGFFAGQQAQQIGLSYHVTDFIKGSLDGVGAFGRGAITPPSTTSPPAQTAP